jgi:ribulose-phosphate 3-epimerase
MSTITPTITTNDPHVYRDQLEKIASYAEGVHIDFADGIFAPNQLLPIDKAWRSDELITHAHIMYQKPLDFIEEIIHLEADLVILHAESDDVKQCLELLVENGTRTGIALLPETTVTDLKELEADNLFDHVLVFGGHLGYQGGDADLDQLAKVKRIKEECPDLEIAWDGGVNLDNAKEIAEAGVDILNTGGTLSKSNNPKNTYDRLVTLVQS